MNLRLQIDNLLQSETMKIVPLNGRHKPKNATGRVWRNKKFLAMEFKEPCGTIRISVNKAEVDNNGDWTDGISWDDLMKVKREIGYGDKCAVELLPPDKDIVNDYNIRHFFILPEPPSFMWK